MADIIDIQDLLKQREAIPVGTVAIDKAEATVIIKALYRFMNETLANNPDEHDLIGGRIANDVILRVGDMFWKQKS